MCNTLKENRYPDKFINKRFSENSAKESTNYDQNISIYTSII